MRNFTKFIAKSALFLQKLLSESISFMVTSSVLLFKWNSNRKSYLNKSTDNVFINEINLLYNFCKAKANFAIKVMLIK